jgi:hypothetical protein
MSDALLPFAKTNFYMMSSRKRRSLYQELHGVAPSSRRIILSSKSQLKGVVSYKAFDPIERHLASLLGCTRILAADLRLLVTHVCDTGDIPFGGTHSLNRATKREVLEWIGANWDDLGEAFTTFAANQRHVNPEAPWQLPPVG